MSGVGVERRGRNPARKRTTGAVALGLAVSLLSACSSRPEVPILTWHQIGDASTAAGADELTVPEPLFLAQLDALARAGFHTVSLAEVLDHADKGAPLPPRPVVLTFDDGTQDHALRALPALLRRKQRATFFLIAGRISPDLAHRQVEQRGGRPLPYLTAIEVAALAQAGMELGAHGLTHARIPELTDEGAMNELAGARASLAPLLGAPPELWAWPYNALRPRHRAMARQAGYRAAVAGVVHGSADRYALYRFPVGPQTSPEALLKVLQDWPRGW
jgi:peptidoglycan/xylan/chitin deacetylase (PgdA/CDA1 family)